MGRRNKQFADPDAPVLQQTSLFCAPKPKYEPYPKIYRHSREAFLGVLERAGEYIGYDLEFDPRRPTILGISNDTEAASLPWDAELARKVRSAGKPLVAFSTVSADKAVADKALGVNSGLNEWEDAMITHYLDNSHLTKAPGKEEDDDPGSMGFMSLGVAVSISTDLPIYKEHRGRDCEGPCPKCDVFGYNAIDAWAGLEVFKHTTASMKRKGIPHSLYRETLELSEVLMKMQQKGVMIDREHVARFNQEQTERKERLFTNIPGKKKHKDQSEMEGIEAFESSAFNPKSPKQIKEYFYRHGILLADTDKNTLEKELAKQSLKAGIQLLQGSDRFSLVEEAYENEKLAGPHLELFKLYTYKSAGKGIDPWFSPKYMDKVGAVHPRFNYTAACTGRLSSSGPNFQNIPKRGLMGNALRRAVIARPGYKLLKADYSQLELRIVLWLAGVDPKEAGKDAFAYFVKQAKGRFDEAAARYSMKPRDVAKSTVHGCNYMEGFVLLLPWQLETAKVKEAIEYGALRVHWDWEYCGGVVAFSGVNIGERLFGDKSFESRKKGLEIQEAYLESFPVVRQWQKKMTLQIQDRGYVQSPTGRYLELFDTPEENAKKGIATLGQGTGADHVTAMMLRFAREESILPIAQIHDELLFEVPEDWSDDRCYDFMAKMTEEQWRLPGFVCPIEVSVGKNWKSQYTTLPDGTKVLDNPEGQRVIVK